MHGRITMTAASTGAQNESQALGDLAARQLANATKTVPQLSTITPRWLLHLLSWVPVEAGLYRVNRVVNPEQVAIKAEEGAGTEEPLPETYVDYETSPREYTLRTISTLLDIHTRVSDLYSSPHDQVAQQLRLTIETIKERQEFELSTARSTACWPRRLPSRRSGDSAVRRRPTTWTRRSPRCGRRRASS